MTDEPEDGILSPPAVITHFRSNNIGVLSVAEGVPTSGKKSLCLVKYHPNRYKGLLDDYLSNGWVDNGEQVSCRGVSLEKSLFSKDEDHYALAFIHLHDGEETTELQSVEDRPAYIEETDYADFFRAYQKANIILLGVEEGSLVR